MTMSNQKFIQRELKENPEFFKAFPHLQVIFGNPPADGTPPKYQGDKHINFSGTATSESPYF